MQSKSALRGRRINNFVELWCLVASGGYKFWVSWISFQKSNISWPQQPPTGKALKFNLIFHDSTKINFVSKHQNKAEFENLVNSEVLRSDFSGLRTSAASVTSTASTASVASMTSTASFHQKMYWSWWFDHHWHPNDKYQSFFCGMDHKKPNFSLIYGTLFDRGRWGPMRSKKFQIVDQA